MHNVYLFGVYGLSQNGFPSEQSEKMARGGWMIQRQSYEHPSAADNAPLPKSTKHRMLSFFLIKKRVL